MHTACVYRGLLKRSQADAEVYVDMQCKSFIPGPVKLLYLQLFLFAVTAQDGKHCH